MANATNFVYDLHYFLTPTDPATRDFMLGELGFRQETDLSDRYHRDVEFAPEAVGVDMWHKTSDGDVLEDIVRVRDAGVDARPLYGFGFSGHWSLEPGEDPHVVRLDPPLFPSELNAVIENAPAGDERHVVVGVVDSGFLGLTNLSALPPGAALTAEMADEIHGTFVSSVIKLEAPGAELRKVDAWETLGAEMERGAFAGARGRCTDDIAIAAAIQSVGGGADFLNLSLGTYLGLVGGVVLRPPAVEEQLARVIRRGVVVVAAGGNDKLEAARWTGTSGRLTHTPMFYPACHDMVIAVGAADAAGQARKWDHGSDVAEWDPWWNVTAPGVDLVGAPFVDVGAEEDVAVGWSGSSFAAACLTGLLAAGTLAIEPEVLITRRVTSSWTQPVTTYAAASGLVWEGSAGVERSP